MKRIFKSEEGSSALYLIWLLGIVAIILLILVNITKVFVVSNESSNAVEQAAIAGTAVIIDETKQVIADYDALPKEDVDLIHHGEETIESLIEKRKLHYVNSGVSDSLAYIKALNDVLPDEMEAHQKLKDNLESQIKSTTLDSKVMMEVQSFIQAADGNQEDTIISISEEYWHLEVEATTTFESVSDQNLIPSFQEDIPGKGYGPSLDYLEYIYQ